MAEIRTTYSRSEVGKLLKIGRSGMDLILANPRMEACIIKKPVNGAAMVIDLAEFVRLRTALKVEAASPRKAASALSYESARAAEKAANAELKQMELAKLRGETVTLEDAARDMNDHVGDLKRVFEELPQRVATALLGDVPPDVGAKVYDFVKDELNLAFERLQTEFPEADDEPETDLDFG